MMVVLAVIIAVMVELIGTTVVVGVVTIVTLGLYVNVYDVVDVRILFVDFVDCFVTQPLLENVETVASTRTGEMAANAATIQVAFIAR